MVARVTNGKAKGAAAEREVAQLLADHFGVQVVRNLEQTRGGGYDLKGLEHLGIAPEVKRQEKLSIDAWWAQASAQALDAELKPVLFYRQNYKPWTVCLDLEDFEVTSGPALIHTSMQGFVTIVTDYLSLR